MEKKDEHVLFSQFTAPLLWETTVQGHRIRLQLFNCG